MKKTNKPPAPIHQLQSSGFTLIELVVTVSVVAILAAVAIPNLRDYGNNSALTATTNDLLHALQIARAEASKSQVNVVVCGSANPKATTPTCSNTGITGWIVFLDTSSNWEHESTESIVAQQSLDSKMYLVADKDAIVSYGASGFANPAGAKTPSTAMVLCDKRGNQTVSGQSTARGINISNSGRANTTRLPADITVMLGSTKINSTCPP